MIVMTDIQSYRPKRKIKRNRIDSYSYTEDALSRAPSPPHMPTKQASNESSDFESTLAAPKNAHIRVGGEYQALIPKLEASTSCEIRLLPHPLSHSLLSICSSSIWRLSVEANGNLQR